MKHKTHKSSSKRIRVSGTGKFMRRRAHTSPVSYTHLTLPTNREV